MNRRLVGPVVAALSALLMTGSLGAGPAPAAYASPNVAAAAHCTSGVPGDVNGDGYAEVAVSASSLAAVHVFYGQPAGLAVDAKGSALDDQQFTTAQLGVPELAQVSSTAFGDFNGDGCADLALSSPQVGPYRIVTVLFGSPTGLSVVGRQHVDTADIEPRGEFSELGPSALSAGDFSGDGIDDLAVGMSDAFDDLSDRGGQGAVLVFFGSATGISTGRLLTIGMQTPGFDIGCWCGFGRALAAGDFDGDSSLDLAVGGPYDGALIQVLEFTGAELSAVQPAPLKAKDPGAPSRHSSLGSELAAGDLNDDGRDDLVAGVGGDGGVVTVLGSARGLTWKGSRAHALARLGLKGGGVPSLAVAPLDARAGADVVIGSAGAKVGSAKYAGAVAVVPGGATGLRTSGTLKFTEATRYVPGSAERNDLFGAQLTATFVQDRRQATLIVSAPNEEVSGHTEAGRIYQFPRGKAGPKAKGSQAFSLDTAGVKGSTTRRPRFGSELS